MSTHVSYIIETNGENGVIMEWYPISYEPVSIVWEDGVNSFLDTGSFPSSESVDSPDYVRAGNDSYEYYRKAVKMPSKTASFVLSVLIDGSEGNGGFYYDSFTSFFSITRNGDVLNIQSKDNAYDIERNGVIKITSNQYDETIEVFIVQEHTPIQLRLLSYTTEEDTFLINDITFTHTFDWLTGKETPEYEEVNVEVLAMGPRSEFIVKDIEKYVYDGNMDSRYIYVNETGKYYETLQKYINGGFQTVLEEVFFNEDTQGVYKKIKYENDLKIVKNKNGLKIVNYGRCFLQDDAFYIITLANVDDLNLTNRITIKYRS